jgi:aminoglycoside phosphotransferase family enzyme/predicted kinase
MTHASKVFLTPTDVWKIKRAVDLGFLDFTTLEARRRCCEDEVRLNRRLAPDVYLGVEPLRLGPRGLTRAGEGPIVEWAVHMTRLPDGDCAATRLAEGRLDADDLAQLAARLADFHRGARETPEAGAPAAIRANVDENFVQSERFVGDLVERGALDEVRAFQRGWLDAHEDLLRARVAEGRAREGHGDLRLEHVYLPRDASGVARPVVIDCLEFSERLRCGDVAADIAFLGMELDAAQRPDLAAGLLARYVESTDDFGLYAALDFYLSYRAWVRGKVAALLAADTTMPGDVRAAKAVEARRRFELARAYSGRPADAPFVIAVAGLPGSGKSTLAAALGRALAVPVASSDLTRKALAGLAPTARGPADLYTNAQRDRTYGELLRRAAPVLDAGRGLVMDATFARRDWRAAAARLARERRARFVLVELVAARSTLEARLARRRSEPSVSDATDQHLATIASTYEPPSDDEGFRVLQVSAGDSPERALGQALEGLRHVDVRPAADRVRS